METPILATARVRLTPIEVGDATALAAALGDPAMYAFIGGSPPSRDEHRKRIQGWLAGPSRAGESWHNWAIVLESDDSVVGHLQATIEDDGKAADTAWMVGTPWQGHGYASEAAIEVMRWLESVGVERITAHIHPQHAASARVAQRAGLEPTDRIEDGEIVWRRTAPSGENPTD